MAESSIFDKLVGRLSADERSELLERIRSSSPVAMDPLLDQDLLLEQEAHPKKGKISEFSFFERLFIYLRSFLSGRNPDSIILADELRNLAREVERRCPGFMDYRRSLLLSPLLEELRKLKDSARFFYDVLDRSFDSDKAAFFAFLASIELPETNARLLNELEPFDYAASHKEASETEIRQAMLMAFDDIFNSLPEGRRKAMYQDLRCLIFLKRLSSFLFERCFGLFRQGAAPDGGLAATFSESRDLLVELCDILFSLSQAPSIELMESLFAFAEHEAIGRPEAEIESILRLALGKAELALGRIRIFNRQVPLVSIVRLVVEDPDHRPRELAAGEDWLLVYRNFWKARLELKLDEFRNERRYRRLTEEIASFVGDSEKVSFNYISESERPDAPSMRQELALAFIEAFYRGSFLKELHRPLKILFVDGDFYRKENRLEYTNAYDYILHVSGLIAELDAKLGPDGEIGKAWLLAKQEVTSLAIKRRKIQSIGRGAEEEAERIIRDLGAALAEIVRVIRGVLKGEAGGRYDSIANLSFIDGKGNKDFLLRLNAAKDRCEKALGLLSELSGLQLESANI